MKKKINTPSIVTVRSGGRRPRLAAAPHGWSAVDDFCPRKDLKGECQDVFGEY